MTTTCDVIVLGVGGFGSAALMYLADRGLDVIGFERFGVSNTRGSSHGETRMIRKAYFEHPDYVPLLHRSYELWHALEQRSGKQLYVESGLIVAGPPDGTAIPGVREASRVHSLGLKDVSLDDARRRFPQFTFAEGDDVVYEQHAGYLHVESCVETHVEQARAAGADCRIETVQSWEATGDSVRVVTDAGQYEAGSLVVSAGAWAGSILADLNLPLTVRRKLLFWHRTQATDWQDAPAFFFDQPDGCYYGFPARTDPNSPGPLAVKLGCHTGGEPVDDPTLLDPSIRPHEADPTNAFIARSLRHVDPVPLRHAVCMYTMTPDEHFLIDRHPQHENVVIAAGFSGHGFKFTPVIGVALADLATTGKTSLPINFLQLDRLSPK